jgi:hypothetical protein
MPRPSRSNRTDAPARGRRRRSRTAADPIVDQITRLVAENQSLQREVASLRADNEQLRGQLDEIGNARGRRRAGRRGGRRAASSAPAPAAPPRKRKPITDPVVLEKRRQALERARAARAQRLAAARAAASASSGTGQ